MLGTYDPVIVLVSFGVSFLGAYTAICGCEQLRITFIADEDHSLYHLMKWYFLIGASLGGVGIWAMHFLGMGALTLSYSEEHHMDDIGYDLVISLLSLLIAVVAVVTGVAVASKDRMFAKTKSQILDLMVDDLQIMSLDEIRKLTTLQYLWMCSTTDLKWLVMGGVIAASGVCVMHYIGMASMEFHGKIKWNVGMVAASLVIAVVASIAAFWILFRLLSMYPYLESLRLISAVIMAVAVCGMHYCGMVAADFIIDPDMAIESKLTAASIEKETSLYSVLFSALMVLWIFTLIVLADLRQRYNQSQRKLKKGIKSASSKTNLSQPSSESIKSVLSALTGSLDNLRPVAGVKWNTIIPEGMLSTDEEHGVGF